MKLICISTIYFANAGWGLPQMPDLFGGDEKKDKASDNAYEPKPATHAHIEPEANPSLPPHSDESQHNDRSHEPPPPPASHDSDYPGSRLKTSLRKSLENVAQDHLDPGSPVDMKLYLSSDCAYAQDFCGRHLFKVLNNPQIPSTLKVIPRFDIQDAESIDSTCGICKHGDESKRRGCKGNLALAYVQGMDIPKGDKVKHLENTMNLFQEAPYGEGNHNIDLWEETFQGLPGLEEKVRYQMEDCLGSQRMIREIAAKFKLGRDAARKEFAELGGKDSDHLTPYFFLDGKLIPLREGIMYAEGFGLANLEELVCVTNPAAPACQGPIEEYALFHGSNMMVTVQNFILVMSSLFAAAMFVTWLRSVAGRPDHDASTILLDDLCET